MTISGTIQGSSMMAESRFTPRSLEWRIMAMVMPVTNLIDSDQKVKLIVFDSDSM